MFTFFDTTLDEERIQKRIRRVLEHRNAVKIGDLCSRVGATEIELRTELEEMVARGEVERLRPVGYLWADYDFFRLVAPAAWTPRSDDGRTAKIVKEWIERIRLAGESMACLAD